MNMVIFFFQDKEREEWFSEVRELKLKNLLGMEILDLTSMMGSGHNIMANQDNLWKRILIYLGWGSETIPGP